MLLSHVTFTCWHIWKARSKFLFNQTSIKPTQVLFAISTSVGVFFDAIVVPPISSLHIPPMDATISSWSHSSAQFLKVNVDANWSASTRNGFLGIRKVALKQRQGIQFRLIRLI